jgi:hypothetical protein
MDGINLICWGSEFHYWSMHGTSGTFLYPKSVTNSKMAWDIFKTGPDSQQAFHILAVNTRSCFCLTKYCWSLPVTIPKQTTWQLQFIRQVNRQEVTIIFLRYSTDLVVAISWISFWSSHNGTIDYKIRSTLLTSQYGGIGPKWKIFVSQPCTVFTYTINLHYKDHQQDTKEWIYIAYIAINSKEAIQPEIEDVLNYLLIKWYEKKTIKFIISSIPHKKHDKYLTPLSLFIKFY